ncbi:hypothetical protein BATDEDRAFT_27923 [Batrachochytrium dendrobatidis JAM81]|uniref:Uncharacterized protein n=1 Tax=Batrachochytrium dendrobatidis (strain JAM81 / FGSC 10211) TaxID=684364 RepID=F4PC33_BATDJ|nr:uncharacterized protein BATDEDRAFT_27923 [Batrachochytrium dendrobatidis JAM81]EGF77241.1 hypothetical protein BATDEDRAFT_27923 [Batrachochytrium dendrobatidis JAM81]|eukprot:XP_006682194.1 hypothetical protein BATDEDRAFT_27923 [Batrachochytrium dendrobatidis JAM81]
MHLAMKNISLYQQLTSLPFELRRIIYKYAGVFTELIHGQLETPYSASTLSQLWAQCLAFDAVHLVSKLPAITLTWELIFLHSERMHKHVWTSKRLIFNRSAITGLTLGENMSRARRTEWFHSVELATRANVGAAHIYLKTLDLDSSWQFSEKFILQQLVIAAGIGDLFSIERTLNSGIPQLYIIDAIELAATHGHLPAVILLCNTQAEIIPSIAGAVQNNHLEIIQYLVLQYPKVVQTCPIEDCVRLKFNEVLIWLLEHTRLTTRPACDYLQGYCVRYGNLELLMYLHSRNIGALFLDNSLEMAAKSGYFKTLQWVKLHMPWIKWDASVIECAAASGNLDIIQWLVTFISDTDFGRSVDLAAINGHIEVLRFLYASSKQTCQRDTIDIATKNGHALVVGFLIDQGQTCSLSAYVWTATHGHFEVIKVLFKHTPRIDWSIVRTCAIHQGHHHISDWLDAQLCS